MTIKNSSSITVSWFCYNHLDAVKLIALNSGNLEEGKDTSYLPPNNQDGFYAVRFTYKGGGTELAAGVVSKEGKIVLEENSEGIFTANVTN